MKRDVCNKMPNNDNILVDINTKKLLVILLYIILLLQIIKNDSEPQSTSILTGQLYYSEMIADNCNPNTFLTVVRMPRDMFLGLLELLKNHGGLQDSVHVSAGEKLMAFMGIIAGSSMRQLGTRWQHSTKTLHRNIEDILHAILACKNILMEAVDDDEPLSAVIRENTKFFPFFENCLGALDGTLIDAIVTSDLEGVFRNRKGGKIVQNVLGVCRFDMTWSYVLAGWEGSAHDGRVLADAYGKGLKRINGRYYLGDAGYGLSWNILTPYRGVRYHLNEWAVADHRPQNREELFNIRHASARNVIERAYGVMKKRFPILKQMPSYPFIKQRDIVIACFLLFNWIRRNDLYADEFDNIPDNFRDPDHDVVDPNYYPDVEGNVNELNAWRNQIAQDMWDQYQAYVAAANI